NLPPVRLKSGERLPPAAVQATVEMLSFSNLDLPYAGLEQLRSACSAESLETLAQDLATRWVTAGAAPAQRWAAQSLALIGGDDAARWLAGQIDRWVAEKSKARWMDALELLAQIGTDRALMWLGRLAQRGRIATLKEAAGEKLSMVAAERGLSLEEMEDRTVPDLGLDEQGSLRLDFGPRQFYVSFDEQLSPVVLDAERQPLAALPRIQKQDDPEKAKAAWEQYKQLKDDASKSCAHQIHRMERAMALERRWSVEEFRAFLLQHPLMRHLVRRLVWAVQGPGQPLTGFRVSEDLSVADCEENILELPAEAEVWVLHPLRMESLLPVWGQIFADYGILQPFPQLSRPIFRPLVALTGDRPLEQYAGRLAGRSWLYGLRSWGWNFDGDPYNGYSSMSRSGPGPLQLRFRLDPGIYEHSDTGKEQKLGAVTLSGGSWADLGEVGYSELIRQLEAVLLR
ncbi:MAG TPA: DUF4132 domain-containing protein, partial [Myxococcota bacterium]|nr:DUF4132 domain-containing protein [Myxococcota bacterium]